MEGALQDGPIKPSQSDQLKFYSLFKQGSLISTVKSQASFKIEIHEQLRSEM